MNFIAPPIQVSEYFVVQEGNDTNKFGQPQGERILSMASQYHYLNGRNFCEFLPIDNWHNKNYIRQYGWSQHTKKLIKITPPQDRKILITLTDSNNIIELLCSSIRFGAFRSYEKNLNDEIENLHLSDLEFLNPVHQQQYPDLMDRLIRIHQYDERDHFGVNSHIKFEKLEDTKLRINKIEVYETETEIATGLMHERVYFSSGFDFRKSVVFSKNQNCELLVNSDDRSATILIRHHYEKYKKCGWDGTLLCDFQDTDKHLVFFKSYHDLCMTFKIKPIKMFRKSIKYKFTTETELINTLHIYIKDPESP